ncbi:ABC transporter permease [Thermomicrobium sp. 4228-Ro]|uniref:ABC transporter permease n=1 Tax=Thermomicrobium sp. 4228-Ro TaxID=2993937 RepID=UPI0022494722|nr:ABC transporter permease [Thermomicrobium sp. 4228-Ro]MCX2728030.1 ABC transporter permease [Thermomicrobium sp. 4228-Ro]
MSTPREVATKRFAPAGRFHWVRSTIEQLGLLPVLLVLLLIFFSIASPNFFTRGNLSTILTQALFLIIVSVAQTLVLLTGGFDLSMGSSIALVSIVAGLQLLDHPDAPATGLLIAMVAAIAVATGIGAINGLFVAIFRVPPFIVTLAMMTAISGLALKVSRGVPVFGLPGYFSNTLYTGKVIGLPVPWLVTILVLVVMYLVLHWTRFGRYWYAIGSNAEAARLSGITVRFYLFLAYTIAGVLVGITGLLLTARVGSGEPTLGASFPLESIAAAVLGGVSIRGGEGNLFGAAIGAIFLVMLRNGMDIMGISTYTQMIITGGLLVIAVIIDNWVHRER